MSFQFFNLGYLDSVPSGGDRHLLLLMAALAEQEQVRCVMPSFAAGLAPCGVSLAKVSCRPPQSLVSMIGRYVWRGFRGTVEALRSPADQVCASPGLYDLVPALIHQRRFGSKVGVFLFHVPPLTSSSMKGTRGGLIRRLVAAFAHRRSLQLARRADVVFVGNRRVRDELLVLGFRSNQVTVHPPAVVRAPTVASGDSHGADVLFVGRLVAAKGIFDLVESLSALDATCRFVGAGEEKARLEIAIDEAGLSNRTAVLGAVDDDRLRELFAGSRCLALPSSEEGYALVIAEALLANVPVVAYELPHYKDVFKRAIDKGLFLVPMGDSARLTETLRAVLQHQSESGFGDLAGLVEAPTPEQAAGAVVLAFASRAAD